MRRGALGAILGALVLLLVAVLVACPAASSGTGPGGGTGQPYVCLNGIPVEGSTDTAGQTRCVSCDHPLFFALEGSSGAIGTTCRTVVEVGEVVRIGTVSNFGVGERRPTGLAAIDNTLYMVGSGGAALYTLNTDSTDTIADGSADQVGSASQFGVGEGLPAGLAAINNILYMVGTTNDILYTLNIDTADTTPDGMAIRVGSASQFGASEGNPSGLAAINNILYMLGSTNDALYTLSATTGRATRVSATSVSQFGVSEDRPSGLAAIGSTLYMVGSDNAVLYTLNTTTGRATRVSAAGVSHFSLPVTASGPGGLASIDNTLYMTDQFLIALFVLRYQ